MNHKDIKTGRNLPVATAVSFAIATVVVASLWFDRWFFAFLITVVSYFAMREMFRLLDIEDLWVQYFLVFSALASPILTYALGITGLIAMLLPLLFVAAVLTLRRGFENFTHRFGSILLSVIYVPLLLSFMVDMARYENGFALVFSLALLNSAVDTGGYFAGILFGKRPLFKVLSPKKTIEGLVGSIGLTLLVAIGVVSMLLSLVLWQSVLVAILAVVLGVVGDLFESALKRERGVKDASHVIPGHGGVLDRIDALLFNAPLVWFLFLYVFQVGVL